MKKQHKSSLRIIKLQKRKEKKKKMKVFPSKVTWPLNSAIFTFCAEN